MNSLEVSVLTSTLNVNASLNVKVGNDCLHLLEIHMSKGIQFLESNCSGN